MILVAGGTGVLGSRIVRLLTDHGEAVRVLTRDHNRARQLPAGIETVVGDVRRGPLDAAVQGCDCVVSAVHGFAGPSRTSPAAVDRDGNRNLIAAATTAGVNRFVLVSVLGAARDHPMSLHRMKYAAEQEPRASTLSGVVVRAAPFLETWLNIVGAKVPTGGPALVLGPGENPINFVSAEDVAAFVCLAVYGDARAGENVSVGGPQNLSFTEIARQFRAPDGSPSQIRHIPLTALKAMRLLASPFHPAFARQAAAAIVMNTTDMTFDALPIRDRFPEIPVTTLSETVKKMASPHPSSAKSPPVWLD